MEMERASSSERHGFKWLLLGMLQERDQYAYALAMDCQRFVGDAWAMRTSTVYTSLGSLEGEGYVEVVGAHPRGTEQNPRIMYRITSQGSQAFDEWVLSSRYEPVRSDLAARFAMVRPRHADAMIEQLRHAEQECIAVIRKLSERIDRVSEQAEIGRWQKPLLRQSLTLGLNNLQARVDWLRGARATLVTQVERHEAGRL